MQLLTNLTNSFQLMMHDLLGKASYGLANYRHPLRSEAMQVARRAKQLASTVTTPLECVELFNAVRASQTIPGEMAELGVFQGGTAAIMLAASSPTRHLYLFDTFAGLPSGEGKLDQGDYASPLEAVRARLATHAGRITFHPGFFPQSVTPAVENATFSFVHLDVDIYDSTLAGLQFFWPRMNPGGIILSHDYPYLDGVVKAFQEYFADKQVAVIPLAGNNCVVVKN
jgi:predicted O-methyltransferase YrrM